MGCASGLIVTVIHAITASSSTITAECAASAGDLPQQNGRVSGHQDAGAAERVDALETSHDRDTCVRLIVGVDLLGGQGLGDGHRTVEIIGVGGAEARDLAPRLRPRRGMARVRVGDAADRGESLVQRDVRVEIRGRPQLAFHDFAVEVGDDDVGRASSSRRGRRSA